MPNPVKINVISYVPVFNRGRRKPLIYYEHMSSTRKGAVIKIVENTYRGAHDWEYRKRMGWSIERVTISNGHQGGAT